MSKVIKIIELSAEWVMPGYTVESLQSSGHVCGYCSGNGYLEGYWKSHTNLTHPGKYFRPSKVKIMRPTSPK